MTGHRKPRPGQSLADRFPDIAELWHPTRNGALTPSQVMPASNTKTWWRCRDGHEWVATVAGRTSRGSGCPVHAGRQVVMGVNDLATRFPDIAAQWHPTRNEHTPDDIVAGSTTRVWWRCEQGHEWEVAVNNRTSRGSGCPVCAGKKPLTEDTTLTAQLPELAAQWHIHNNGDLRADQVSVTTGQKVWWCCPTGHVYQAGVAVRVRGVGCPLCPATSGASETEAPA